LLPRLSLRLGILEITNRRARANPKECQ